jgi:hypothetical protein
MAGWSLENMGTAEDAGARRTRRHDDDGWLCVCVCVGGDGGGVCVLVGGYVLAVVLLMVVFDP